MQVFTGNQVSQAVKNTEHRTPGAYEQSVVEKDFHSILQNNIAVQFSRHANTRLNARDISLSADQLERVEGAIIKAREKGIKDSLVLIDDVALVVNIKNKMVVTAMNRQNNNIFTNIDGAVIA